MNRDELARRIHLVVAAVMELPADTIAPDTVLAELGADDLDVLEIVFEAEHIADVELDDADIECVKTVADLVEAFARHLQAIAA
jgi:acyl carrier protein